VLFTTFLLWRFFFPVCAQRRPGFRSAALVFSLLWSRSVALFFPSQGFPFLRQSMVVVGSLLVFSAPARSLPRSRDLFSCVPDSCSAANLFFSRWGCRLPFYSWFRIFLLNCLFNLEWSVCSACACCLWQQSI
jgi:hypothetical protein